MTGKKEEEPTPSIVPEDIDFRFHSIDELASCDLALEIRSSFDVGIGTSVSPVSK